AFADHLRIPLRAHNAMRRNLENRLQFRWEELHVPTLARRMKAPALVIHDRGDTDVPYVQGAEVASAWPGAELLTTSGLGHRAVVRDPEVIRRTIDFLKDGLTR
ncbi:MAG: alpha/beta hydrolase, partial [Gemmatimonadota bacterium]|nr:alpha/beta hydrolase [Gemmatimonadota bacterium]